MLRPKLLDTFKDYNRDRFTADLSAGTIVGVVALPLAIAFAIASGVSPERGLYTAIIAGFLISFLSGSKVQIGGPTGAFVVIVYGIVEKYGVDGLIIATIMAGVILILMGLAKFGGLIKYIPHPIITGFTSGIAVIIFSTQIRDFFGLSMDKAPGDFVEKWAAYIEHWSTVNFYALGIGIGTLLIIIFWSRFSQKIPGSLAALIISTCVVYFFQLPVDTIYTRFGEIPSSLPAPIFPNIQWSTITALVMPATTIALLGAIESLLCAVVADGMIGDRHRSNMELIAQGLANIITPFFGGIPATGAIARTATNIRNGGRTPIAGIIHALVLLLILLIFGKWAALIPLPCLAAILIYVAYNMSEHTAFVAIMRGPRTDVIVLMTTFVLTVLVDLTVAIEIGMILAAFLFMKQMADVTRIQVIKSDMDDHEEPPDTQAIKDKRIPQGVQVFEINGPFFFGSVYKFQEHFDFARRHTRVLILRMRSVPYVDAGGLHALREMMNHCRKDKVYFLIAEIHTQPLIAVEQSGLMQTMGEDYFFGNLDEALATAGELIKVRPAENTESLHRHMREIREGQK